MNPDEVQVYEGDVGLYEILQPTDYFNEEGDVVGQHAIGEIVELPEPVGEQFVLDGKAKKVEAEAEAEVPAEAPIEAASDPILE